MGSKMSLKSKGLTINASNYVLSEKKFVTLDALLTEIPSASELSWCIQCIDINGYSGENPEFWKKIEKEAYVDEGYFISWEELLRLSQEVTQFIWLVLIGCADKHVLKSYSTDLERYEHTDYNIEMFDGWLWHIFTKDHSLINTLERKYQKTEFISPTQTEGWKRF